MAVFYLAVMTASAQAATPSFDCDGVHSEIETLICSDDVLAALDMRLARNFARALARANAGDVADLRADQRVWHAGLLKCGKVDGPHACVLDAYDKRNNDLKTGTGKRNRPGR